MMDPTCTFSSPNFFTPRYLGLESRPFLVDPVPFLCAHSMTAVRGLRSATRCGATRASEVAIANFDARAACMTFENDDATDDADAFGWIIRNRSIDVRGVPTLRKE